MMSDCRRRSGTIHIGSTVLALAMVGIALPSCSEHDDTPTGADDETSARSTADNTPDGACLWETNELLSQVNAQTPELVDCGMFAAQQPLENECFSSGQGAESAVQITINNCIDCMIHSTYVSTPSAGKFHLYREADYFGDALRVVRVDSCTDFVPGQGRGANCAEPAMLYSCSDPLPDPSDL